MNAIVEREITESESVILPEYVPFKQQILALQTPAREMLLALYNEFQHAIEIPNENLPKEFRNSHDGATGRSIRELEFIMSGKKHSRNVEKFDHRQTENNLAEYIAQDLEMGDETALQFCENEERLERAQRNFLKGLIRVGAIDADELLEE